MLTQFSAQFPRLAVTACRKKEHASAHRAEFHLSVAVETPTFWIAIRAPQSEHWIRDIVTPQASTSPSDDSRRRRPTKSRENNSFFACIV
jgi:hypothetical protein